MLKSLIKRVLVKAQLSKSSKKAVLFNVFKTNNSKNVLVVYITSPITQGVKYTHTSTNECLIICKTFCELGYNVDLVDFDYELENINYTNYQVIFGFGEPLENAFGKIQKEKTKAIYYGTGNHFYYINNRSIKRIEEIYREKGVLMLKSARYSEYMWSLQNILSDAMIVLGNNFTVETYRNTFDKKIYALPASFYKTIDKEITTRNISEAKKNFVWFGSNGLIHKGLDILLEIFIKRPDLKLHVCGANPYEKDFFEIYDRHLFKTDNIINHGIVDLNSNLFRSILEDSLFVVFPSFSEGGCASVVTIMGNGGLIPIISKSSALDVYDFGLVFEECTIENVEAYINKAINMNDDDLYQMSRRCYSLINEHHSTLNYSIKVKQYLTEILNYSN